MVSSRNDSVGLPDLEDLPRRPPVAHPSRLRYLEVEHMDPSLRIPNDRRERQRFSVNAPLTVRSGDLEIPAFTRDLSNTGVYFFLAVADEIPNYQDFDFVVELPPEITLSTFCRIQCRGRVVRTDKASKSLTGIGAEILGYSILREAMTAA
jgi:hypothetical protein